MKVSVWVLTEERNVTDPAPEGGPSAWVLGVYGSEGPATEARLEAEDVARNEGKKVSAAGDADSEAEDGEWDVCFRVTEFPVLGES